jgi:hypothetical protein
LTVKELKDIIKDWPEKNEEGDDFLVWIGHDCISNICTEVWPLNVKDNKADIIFEY